MKLKPSSILKASAFTVLPLVLAIGCAGNGSKTSLSMKSENITAVETTQHEDLVSTETSTVNDFSDTVAIPQVEETIINDAIVSDTIVSDTIVSAEETIADISSETAEESGLMEVKLSQPERILTETPEKSRFHFDANQTEISADDLEILQQHATYLMNNPGLHLVLEAHSDAQGSAAYNYKLSEKRAEKVVNILLQYGVSSDLITVNNYGESFPLHEENNWKENRRVEFKYEEATVPSDLVVSSY